MLLSAVVIAYFLSFLPCVCASAIGAREVYNCPSEDLAGNSLSPIPIVNGEFTCTGEGLDPCTYHARTGSLNRGGKYCPETAPEKNTPSHSQRQLKQAVVRRAENGGALEARSPAPSPNPVEKRQGPSRVLVKRASAPRSRPSSDPSWYMCPGKDLANQNLVGTGSDAGYLTCKYGSTSVCEYSTWTKMLTVDYDGDNCPPALVH